MTDSPAANEPVALFVSVTTFFALIGALGIHLIADQHRVWLGIAVVAYGTLSAAVVPPWACARWRAATARSSR